MHIPNLLKRLFQKTNPKRKAFFLFCDTLLIVFSIYWAFYLRVGGPIPVLYWRTLWVFCLLSLLVKIPLLHHYGLYTMSWTFVSLHELLALFKALTLGSIILTGALFMLRTIPAFSGFPRWVIFIDYFNSLLLIGGLRAAKRVYLQGLRTGTSKGKVRILVIGAGSAGEEIVRDMLSAKNSRYFPLGFVDDDPAKQEMKIHGLKVFGGREKISELVARLNIEEVVITMPSVLSREIRDMVKRVREAGIKKIKIVPGLQDIMSGHVQLNDIREVQVEDLLGREPVRIDPVKIEEYISGRAVLVTGAGGSIGSELCRQVAKLHPKCLVMLDQDETALFCINNELNERKLDFDLLPIVGNIRDKGKLERIFTHCAPRVIFHAAAYKHVPVLESHIDEAVKNNIIGTRLLAEISQTSEVEKFILISTDKAVNPTSVMGATKRVAEMLVQSLNGQPAQVKFLAVRFGNVLESRGSVIPTFKEQLRKGEALTVTHPEMRRYFMTVSEATALVLQAGTMGEGGEVFVLDMGEPVRIMDIAEEFIRLAGFEPDKDIPIVFTGIRPGEKLFEEILTAEEGTSATTNNKILVARTRPQISRENLHRSIEKLEELANAGDGESIVALLKQIVPTYKPNRLASG